MCECVGGWNHCMGMVAHQRNIEEQGRKAASRCTYLAAGI